MKRSRGSSKTQMMKERVLAAQHFSMQRNEAFGCRLNRDIPPQYLADALGHTPEGLQHLVQELGMTQLSTRAVVRCLRVSRTVADLAERKVVLREDIVQAWMWGAHEAARLRGEFA